MSIQRLVNMNIHSSFIHNSQKLEGTKMSNVHQHVCVWSKQCTYTMEYQTVQQEKQ